MEYEDYEPPREIKPLGDLLRIPTAKKKSSIHSEFHELAEKCYKQFGETAKKGKGSFPFYLGFIKRLGLQSTYRILAELRESGKEGAVKLFWWKVSQELKVRKVRRIERERAEVKGSTQDK